MVAFDHCRITLAAFDHIRVDRSLCKCVYMPDLPGFFFKYPDEFFADDLALGFRIPDACKLLQEARTGIDADQMQAKGPAENILDKITFIFPKQT